MSIQRRALQQPRSFVFGGGISLALLIGGSGLLAPAASGGGASGRPDAPFAAAGERFESAGRVIFQYLPPRVGGLSTRYKPISQQVEAGFEPTLTASMPLILAAHINAFDDRPDVARTTSGDIAAFSNQAPIATTTRYALLMNGGGDQYLLTLDELVAPEGDYDAWRITFTYESVRLPLGAAGGTPNPPLPGKLVFRDWYRTKMIMRVDLTTGAESPLVDGVLPTALGDRLLGYGDATSAYVVRDAAGRTVYTTRFNEWVTGPILSPDGTWLVGSVRRPGPDQIIGGMALPGPEVLAVGVFDLTGRELIAVGNYDDANWTPDGRLVATGALIGAGLFEIDPRTGAARGIAPDIINPSSPSVSPDGRTIAFVTGGKVWLIGRDGQNLRQLFPHGMTQQRPVFSPDGTKVAFIICNTMASDVTGEIFVMDLETGKVIPIRTQMGSSLVPDPDTRLSWVP